MYQRNYDRYQANHLCLPSQFHRKRIWTKKRMTLWKIGIPLEMILILALLRRNERRLMIVNLNLHLKSSDKMHLGHGIARSILDPTQWIQTLQHLTLSTRRTIVTENMDPTTKYLPKRALCLPLYCKMSTDMSTRPIDQATTSLILITDTHTLRHVSIVDSTTLTMPHLHLSTIRTCVPAAGLVTTAKLRHL